MINALTERTRRRTALVTTEGFRDVLEIGRANRPDLYNLSYRKPRPFVPRRLRFEVPERISHKGKVLVPLSTRPRSESVARRLRALEVEAIAICFLHAWTNHASTSDAPPSSWRRSCPGSRSSPPTR